VFHEDLEGDPLELIAVREARDLGVGVLANDPRQSSWRGEREGGHVTCRGNCQLLARQY
jgi:hypothetical protein